MFEENDRTLHMYYVLICVVLWLFLVASIVAGILVGIVDGLIGIGIVIAVCGIVLTLIVYIVARALFGLFLDIKLIRNKLYDTSNSDLEKYYKTVVAVPNDSNAHPQECVQNATVNEKMGHAFCTKCGGENSAEAKFCIKCGNKME